MPAVERQPTRDDVLAYAAELRAYAAGINNPSPGNPKHRPYTVVWSPTDEYARYLSRKHGPAKAMATLEHRASLAKQQLELDEEVDKAREQEERRRRERERRDAEEISAGKSPGKRIDESITKLRVMASGQALKIEPQVLGGVEHPSDILLDRNDEELRRAISSALGLARRLENMVERLRRSPLPPPKLADRDAQLRAFTSYTPYQVAQLDPRQGLPRQIRERREAMGLDPETGDKQFGEAA